MTEIWKSAIYISEKGEIINFENFYEVSNLGNIRSIPRNGTVKKKRLIKQYIIKDHYHRVCLQMKGIEIKVFVHRLVLSTFKPNLYFSNAVVNHIDENPDNNCLNNLEWVTQKQNVNHGTGIERRTANKKKPIEQYDLNGNYLNTFPSAVDVEKQLNIHRSAICSCCKGKFKTAGGFIWKYKRA